MSEKKSQGRYWAIAIVGLLTSSFLICDFNGAKITVTPNSFTFIEQPGGGYGQEIEAYQDGEFVFRVENLGKALQFSATKDGQPIVPSHTIPEHLNDLVIIPVKQGEVVNFNLTAEDGGVFRLILPQLEKSKGKTDRPTTPKAWVAYWAERKDPFQEGKAWLTMASRAETDAEREDAYRQAAWSFRGASRGLWAAHAYTKLGSHLWPRGNMEEGEEALSTAIDLTQSLLAFPGFKSLPIVFSLRTGYEKEVTARGPGYALRHYAARAMAERAYLNYRKADVRAALHDYREALGLYEKLDDIESLAEIHQYTATTYSLAGRYEDARDHFQQARHFEEQLAPRESKASFTMWEFNYEEKRKARLAVISIEEGWLHFLENKPEEALPYYQRALDLLPREGKHRKRAGAWDRTGSAYRDLGEWDRAEQAYDQALTSLPEDWPEGNAHLSANRADLHIRAGRLEKAQAFCDHALPVFEEHGDTYGKAHVHYLLSQIHQRHGQLDQALREIETCVSLLDEIWQKTHDGFLGRNLMHARYPYYDQHVDLLKERYLLQPTEAYGRALFMAAEHIRARELERMLIGHEIPAPRELLAMEGDLTKKLDRIERKRYRIQRIPKAARDRKRMARQIQKLLAERAEVRAEIREARTTTTDLQPPDFEDLATAISRHGDLMLFYHLGEQGSLLITWDKQKIRTYPLPPRATIETKARQLHQTLALPGQNHLHAQRDQLLLDLSTLLLDPVKEQLPGKRLVLIKGGLLHYLPFAVLPLSAPNGLAQPLSAMATIVNLPSATLGWFLERKGDTSRPLNMAVFADPVFTADDPRGTWTVSPKIVESQDLIRAVSDLSNPSFPRLPHSREEADALARMLPSSKVYQAIGFAANREEILEAPLQNYAILHFATHGLVHPRYADLSGLVFSLVSPMGWPRDGFLRTHHIARLELNAELVTLSACRTGKGEALRGEGIWGMGHAFFSAGARRVILSLWDVDDQAGAAWMETFYEALLIQGLTPPEAVQKAQEEIMNQPGWEDPFYWAGFVLQGSGAPLPNP